MLNGRIYYGKSDGKFYFRTLPAANDVGRPADPSTRTTTRPGARVLNGSAAGTLPGCDDELLRRDPQGHRHVLREPVDLLHARRGHPAVPADFSPGTAASPTSGQDIGGVVSPFTQTVTDSAHGGLVNFTNAGGMSIANGRLWLASRNSGSAVRGGLERRRSHQPRGAAGRQPEPQRRRHHWSARESSSPSNGQRH